MCPSAGPPPHRGPALHGFHRPGGRGSRIAGTVVHSIGSLGWGLTGPPPVPIHELRGGWWAAAHFLSKQPTGRGAAALARRLLLLFRPGRRPTSASFSAAGHLKPSRTLAAAVLTGARRVRRRGPRTGTGCRPASPRSRAGSFSPRPGTFSLRVRTTDCGRMGGASQGRSWGRPPPFLDQLSGRDPSAPRRIRRSREPPPSLHRRRIGAKPSQRNATAVVSSSDAADRAATGTHSYPEGPPPGARTSPMAAGHGRASKTVSCRAAFGNHPDG